MVRTRARYTALGLGLLLAACVGDPLDPEGSGSDPAPDASTGSATIQTEWSKTALPLARVPTESVALARELLAQTQGSEMTREWSAGVRLDDLAFMYERPDVEGPAYYEFAVLDHGRITVATGTHDTPIPTFSDRGEPIALKLLDAAEARGESVAHLYRFDARHAVATNEEGRVVADLDPSGSAVGLFLDDYLSTFDEDERTTQKSRTKRQLQYAEDWDAIFPVHLKKTSDSLTTRPALAVKEIKWLYHSDLLLNHIHWYQFPMSYNPECLAGCGPVALSQVAAYLAYSDRWGNPKYLNSGSRNLFPNVNTRPTSSEAYALQKSLHTELSSLCMSQIWKDNSLSAAMPWNMSRFVAWAKARKADVRYEDSYVDGGDNVAAWNALRRGNPVIFGWPYDHYNIGVGAGTLSGVQYIWVNNGQRDFATYDGWLRLGETFYTGIFHSWVVGK